MNPSVALFRNNQNSLSKFIIMAELKRAYRQQQNKQTVLSDNKILSPLAKYENGKIKCIICKTFIKSDNLWKVHINSKHHKEKLHSIKNIKNISKVSDTSNVENIPKEPVTVPVVLVKPLAKVIEQVSNVPQSSNEELLPKSFFDNPEENGKAQKVESKTTQDIEWENFQREIKEESILSNAIISGEQENNVIEKQIDEIHEQMYRWTKVIDLERKKDTLHTPAAQRKSQATNSYSVPSSDEDNDSFDEFSNWRSKKY